MAHGSPVVAQIEQMEMPFEPAIPDLTASQAACLQALREGKAHKTHIAFAAGLSLDRTQRALAGLAEQGLAKRAPGHRWRPTPRGRTCRFRTVSDRTRRGDGKLGRTSLRALHALDRPLSESALAVRLGVTRQRAHQVVVDLHAAGRIRLGDRQHGFSIIARADDPTPLLSRREERVLSAVPEHYATTATKIRLAAKCNKSAVGRALKRMLRLGLIARADKAAGPGIYRLTQAGAAHPQYRMIGGRADPPSLPVRSDRVCAVLTLLAERGHAQIGEVGDALDIAYQSINALFQYLKRKALVQKDRKGAGSSYVLTLHGHEVLADMRRRRAA